MSLVHIVNGDSTATILEQCHLQGEILIFREALSDGQSSHWDREERIRRRSEFLALEYAQPLESVLKSMEDQEADLDRAIEASQVVLWFEYDLFCSLHLCRYCRC